jgi:hypothetical protein
VSGTPPNAGSPGTVRRWRCAPSAGLPGRRSLRLSADRGAIPRVGGAFILTCKPSSHVTVSEYLHGATLEQHRQTEKVRGRRTTTIHRWLSEVPLRATADALAVTWVSIEIQNAAGKRNITTASSPIWTSTPAMSPNSPRVAGRAGRSRTKPSTCSKPTNTTASTTSGTVSRRWPASSSSSIYSSVGSIPPTEPSRPAVALMGAQHIAQLGGHSDRDGEVRHRQHLRLTTSERLLGLRGVTLRAAAVAAGMIAEHLGIALLAAPDLAAERPCSSRAC